MFSNKKAVNGNNNNVTGLSSLFSLLVFFFSRYIVYFDNISRFPRR